MATIWDVSVSPNGQYIAISSDSIIIYDDKGHLIQTLPAHMTATIITAWSPDGSILASGGLDNYLRLWDTSTWTLISQIETNSNEIYELGWRSDGAVLSGNSFDTFYIWDTATWDLLIDPISVTLTEIEWINNTTFIFAGTPTYVGIATFIEGDLTVDLFPGHDSTPYAVASSPTGDRIVSAGGEDGTIRLWDTFTSLELAILLDSQEIVTDALFIDSQYVVASSLGGNIYTIDSITNKVINIQHTGLPIRSIDWNNVTEQLMIVYPFRLKFK